MENKREITTLEVVGSVACVMTALLILYVFVARPTISASTLIDTTEAKAKEQIHVCSDGSTFGGYGKMEIRDDGQIRIHAWSFDKAKTELYVAKDNARNFANDIDFRYKVVEIYYKDVE